VKKGLLFLILFVSIVLQVKAQVVDRSVTYEELYDSPYEIHKLFVSFQPIYTDVFVSNINVGFGVEANYFLSNKANFHAAVRRPYGQKYDMARDIALKNVPVRNENLGRWWNRFSYYELGGTYHIKDQEKEVMSKVILYSNRYKGKQWASKVAENIKVPSKVRRIYGARLGGIFFDSTTDLTRAIEEQGIGRDRIVDMEGNQISNDAPLFANIYSRGLYLGGSLINIKNFAIKPDKFSALTNDLIFTAFFDILIAPSVGIGEIIYEDRFYSTDAIKKNILGARVGMDGKFNRDFSWAYGAEMGWRPSVNGRGFYALVKISFPVVGTSIDNSREAFGK
jgi:hypothetical protein